MWLKWNRANLSLTWNYLMIFWRMPPYSRHSNFQDVQTSIVSLKVSSFCLQVGIHVHWANKYRYLSQFVVISKDKVRWVSRLATCIAREEYLDLGMHIAIVSYVGTNNSTEKYVP